MNPLSTVYVTPPPPTPPHFCNHVISTTNMYIFQFAIFNNQKHSRLKLILGISIVKIEYIWAFLSILGMYLE